MELTQIDDIQIFNNNEIIELEIRELAKIIENEKHNIRVLALKNHICLINISNKNILFESQNKYLSYISSMNSLGVMLKGETFTKENVFKVIKDLLLDGVERRALNSIVPGRDNKSCKKEDVIYSIAFIKRHVFKFSDSTSKHKKFTDILLELEQEKKIRIIVNAVGHVIGCELLDRKLSNAEQLLLKLTQAEKIHGLSCGNITLFKERGESYSKHKKHSNDHDIDILVDPKNDNLFKLYINRNNLYSLYAKNVIDRYKDIFDSCDFFKIYENEMTKINDVILEDINKSCDINLSAKKELKYDSKGFFFNISYNF